MIIGSAFSGRAATKVWDGRGTNSLWSNRSNWVDKIAPLAGDDLVFPATNSFVHYNDFPAGTIFNSLLIRGNYQSFDGNLIGLNAGITTEGYITVVITLPVRLQANQTFFFSSNFSRTVEFRGSGIDLNGFELTLAGPGMCDVRSTISGNGAVVQRSSQSITLWGTNTFSGPLRVESGVLNVRDLKALGDSVDPTEVMGGAVLSVQTSGLFSEPLVLAGGSRIIGGTWGSSLTLTGPNVGFVNSVTIFGNISGNGGIAFLGNSDTLTVWGANTYSGTNRITAGTFMVNGNQPASEVFIDSAANLAGVGRIGPITCPNGQIRPGTNSTAVMTCGDLNLGEYGALVIEIKGGVAGASYDQLNVIGTVNLANSFLLLSNTFAAAPGNQLVIISNDGSDPVSGTFGGLPEGVTLAAGSVKFRISYIGGDGNDVVLTALAPPAPGTGVTRIWDGGGANAFWSTAENWVGDVAPASGDDLEFPAGTAQLTNVNDFPADTTFNLIRLAAGGYRLEGARVALNAGLSAAHASGTNELVLPLLLNTNQTFNVSAPLRILSAIDTDGSDLAFAGQGDVEIIGTISGTGGISKLHAGRLSLLAANTYRGITEVLAGELTVSNTAALGSSKYRTFILNDARLTLHTAVGEEPLTIQGKLRSAGAPTNIITTPIAFTRVDGVHLEVSNTLVLHDAPTGTFRKLGAGTLVLDGTGQSSSTSTVSNGTVLVNGYLQSILSLVNGVIGGTGRLYSITAPESSASTNRVISPGLDQPAILTMRDLILSRTTLASAPARVAIQLNGTEPGTGYDQLRIESFVNVNNAQLDISLGFTPVRGDRFVIIETPYGAQGRFLSMRQGAAFMVGDTQFQISYRGGDGNDVELRVTRGLSLTRTWDGGGTNGFWSNPQNWVGDIAPLPGEFLAFPNSLAQRRANTNDFPAGTEFSILAIDGQFQLYGAPITMDVGLLAYETATVALPITLLTNVQFLCDKDVYATNPIIEFRGGIDLAGYDLTFSNSAPIRVRGQLGPGNLIKAGTGRVELYTNNLHHHNQVRDGELAIYHSSALGDIGFPVEVLQQGSLLLSAANLTIQKPLTLWGTLVNSNVTFPGGSNDWAGEITLDGTNAAFSFPSPLFISGLIKGSGGFVKLGSGVLLLTADNTYTGATIVSNGVLFVHGSQPQSPVFLRSGTLRGRGSVGHVIATSFRLQPGNGPANSLTDPAILTCRNLTAHSNMIFGFALLGPAAGSERDQLIVNGDVAIEDCRLELRMRFRPEVNDSFVLIENDGEDPVTGRFRTVPEGGLVVQSNMLFRISYVGGDGNDVTLTRIAAPPSTISSMARQSDSMLLQGVGISNLTYSVQAASNLNLPIFWETIGTSSANRSNVYQFIDTNSLLPMRFYRVMSP